MKTIKKYPKAKLVTCGEKNHNKGCVIELKEGVVDNSEERIVLLDYNKKGELISIDLSWNI